MACVSVSCDPYLSSCASSWVSFFRRRGPASLSGLPYQLPSPRFVRQRLAILTCIELRRRCLRVWLTDVILPHLLQFPLGNTPAEATEEIIREACNELYPILGSLFTGLLNPRMNLQQARALWQADSSHTLIQGPSLTGFAQFLGRVCDSQLPLRNPSNKSSAVLGGGQVLVRAAWGENATVGFVIFHRAGPRACGLAGRAPTDERRRSLSGLLICDLLLRRSLKIDEINQDARCEEIEFTANALEVWFAQRRAMVSFRRRSLH